MLNLNTLKALSLQLGQDIVRWQQVIDESPEGQLISRRRGESYDYYFRDGSAENSKEIYIPKSKSDMAEKMALRDYAKQRIKEITAEKQAIDNYISVMTGEKLSDEFLKKHPGAGSLVIPKLRKKDDYIQKWANAGYRRSSKYPDKLIYPTILPELKVRSKAEADIISRFLHFGIPFRYEEELIINGIVYSPDFTCLNIQTMQEIYFEHYGQPDTEEYISMLERKADIQRQAGIIPWKNLIITTETANMPLDINWVDEVIKYFLM